MKLNFNFKNEAFPQKESLQNSDFWKRPESDQTAGRDSQDLSQLLWT
jgi:hypothetical protein